MAEVSQYVIYDHPADHPDHFVVREWTIGKGPAPVPSDNFILAASLEEARTHIPEGLVQIGRMPNDDPVIVEVWI